MELEWFLNIFINGGIRLNVIVTGATGVIGIALVKKLISEGCQIYAVCREDSRRLVNLPEHPAVHKIFCEIGDFKSLPQRINIHCDLFFHLAWAGADRRGNRFDMYLQQENIRYALDAVEAAHGLGCTVFVGAGSQAEYGPVADGILRPDTRTMPDSGYGMAKLCAGQMTRLLCKQYGIRHIWPRVLAVYGPSDTPKMLIEVAIWHFQAGKTLEMTEGTQLWDYLYASDAADAFYLMALKGKDGAVYPLGSGKARPLREYIETIRDIFDRDVAIEYGKIPYLPDQIMHIEADISTLTQDTGWHPRTIFSDGIRQMLLNQEH